MKKLLLFIFVVSFAFAKNISILLEWKYQFEFAGYIAAKEKGFYKDLGLNVKLVEYDKSDIVTDVLKGKYDFGIYDNNLIVDKIKGKNVKLVSSIFKRSALILIVKNNINTLKDLEYKTIMVAKKDLPTFKSFFKYNGIDVSTIKFIVKTYDVDSFVKDKNIVAFSAFMSNEVFTLAQKGINFKILNPSDYNFLLYQGELFTSGKFANENPIVVDKIKKATIKGWEYALNHKKELINIIYNKYNTQHKSKDALRYEANKIEQIVEPFIYPIGYINKPLLESQFIDEARKLHIQHIDSKKLVNEYVFEFKNPLNLDEKYLWVIQLYNFYLKYTYSIVTGIISLIIIIVILFFYKKVQRQKEKIETLFDKAPVSYVLMDFETRIIKKVNEYGLKLGGYPEEAVVNKNSLILYKSKEDYDKFRELALEYINQHKTINGFNVIWQFKKYDGTLIWVNVKAFMFSEKEVLWIVNDIDEIIKTKEQLQHQILETQKVMKVKEEFLANMSHEIRTPLNAMLGFIDIIDKREKDKENKKYLNVVRKSGKQLLSIINDILDFSKIESGKLSIEKIEFNPKEEFHTIISLFEQQAYDKNINLKINFSNLDYCIIQDPTRIKQVISNLLSNAIKFTPSEKNIYCNINYNSTTEKLYVEVIDEGIGIEKEKLDKIFEAFSQADTSTTRRFGGTGLGLTISKKLVELLGGELKIESEINKGSKFYFSIPAPKTTKSVEKTTPLKSSVIDKKFQGKILVVEDNKANQMFFKVILNSLGIKDIDIANDGVEAIEKVKTNNYDIIFMDENMPNMNGMEATKKIKELGIKTPIIAVTANALSGDKEKFLSIMDDYLAKPIEKEKLTAVLNKYLKVKNG